MKSIRFFLPILLISVMFSCDSAKKDKIDDDVVVMAYYVAPRDNYRPQDLPLDKLTHIIFSFTEVIDNKMQFKREISSEKLKRLVEQKKAHPHLKVMIACGGWGAGGFSDMVTDPVTRKGFVKSAIDFIVEYNLDGLDMDWEYPGIAAPGTNARPEDKQNFTALMRELREGMDATGKKLTLTFASAGWKRYYDHIETLEVMKYADYMNVMTYDLVGGYSKFPAHHTNLGWIKKEDVEGTPWGIWLEESEWRRGPRSAEKIVSYCLELGVNPQQIVIGGAFYGRAWKGVPPENNGLYQTSRDIFISWAQYGDIREKYEGINGYVRYWDPVAKAPYLYNAQDSIFFSYDDTVSVKLKTSYAREKGLGGIMFWQLGDDTDDYSLVDAIHQEKTGQ
ncbi:glycoside hydrolase family 18 protein [Bacteroidota bacterium]